MEQISSNKFKKVVIATFRWLGFSTAEVFLTILNLLIIGACYFYFSWVFGDTPRIDHDVQSASIKKVDGFYLIQGDNNYYERTFPDCKIKFYNKTLEFKDGDVFDGNKRVTDKVSIQGTRGGFRVYYMNKSYPLNTITNIDGLYSSIWSTKTKRMEMYAKDGVFYIDVDNRHWLLSLIALGFVLTVLITLRYSIAEFVRNSFNHEYKLTVGRAIDFLDNLLGKKEED